MKKLEINKVNGYMYELIDKNSNKVYNFNIEFYNLKKYPKKKDILFVQEELLQRNYQILSFDSLGSKFGRKIILAEDKDLAILKIDNEKIYLQRVYG